jgi:hypothetical protein
VIVQAALNAVPKLAQAGWKVLVPLGVSAVVAAGVATKGMFDVSNGGKARKEALARLDAELEACELVRLQTDAAARKYGEFMLQVHQLTVGRLADWLERNEHLVKRLNFKKVDGVRIRVPNIPKYVANAESIKVGVGGIAAAVGASASAPAAALWGVSAFASASTGTAISSLSGIAAQNAVFAWLGGGTLATGGGGVAAGTAVLGAIAVLPALLIGGFTMGIVGAHTKTKSRKFVATTNLEIERLGLARALLLEVERRIEELNDVLARLSQRASRALDALESVDFDPALHASEFLRAYQLVTAVKEVLNTPILDSSSGELTEASIEILRKYI